MTEPTKNLTQKLIEVGASIGILEKDAVNPHHKYRYASEKAIKEAVYPKLHAAGVLFWLEAAGEPVFQGSVMLQQFIFHIRDADSGEEITGPFYGSGRGDDKGFYVCVTGCIKYVLTTILGIVTGDDAEKDHDAPATQPKGPVKKPAPKRPASPKDEEGPPSEEEDVLLQCERCGERFMLSSLNPKAQFSAKWADKEGRWEKGEHIFWCPSQACYGEKVLNSVARSAALAADSMVGEDDEVPF